MPMPRRLNYEIQDPTVEPGALPFLMVRHDLTPSSSVPPPANLDAFDSLASELGAMDIADEQALSAVESHPRFQEAMTEYMLLMAAMLPSCSVDELAASAPESDAGCASGAASDPQLDDALDTLIELLRRRRERAQQFHSTVQQFVEEYAAMQHDLSAAEPLLKGSQLSAKIEDMKERVKRKYGAKIEQLQQECVNKRRRANLPKPSVQVMEKWFREHQDHPYPNEDEKKSIAQKAGIREDQVSNWFVNVRKRYWKSPGVPKA